MLPPVLTVIDVETTGISPHRDKIIELGIIRIQNAQIVDSFNTLINPQGYLPREITMLTGIRPEQLEQAPTFHAVRDRIRELMDGSIFVAHNARFDYAFIKSEFLRLDESFFAKILCTARLSKKLYPRYRHHNLDSIIRRFAIPCANRHRAYDDAGVLWEFLQKAASEIPAERLDTAIRETMKTKSLPASIPHKILEDLPETCGVYVFYDSQGQPLYIGKSINLRERILSHFTNATANALDGKIFRAVASIETHRTDGELAALLLESKLIKSQKPLYNRQLRKTQRIIVAFQHQTPDKYFTVSLEELTTITADMVPQILAIYRSRKQAKDSLHTLAKEHQLCKKLLSLENAPAGCFGTQIESCRGACTGRELPAAYNLRFMDAFRKTKIRQWPFREPIIITQEKSAFLISHWCILGEITEHDQPTPGLHTNTPFDLDSYKILSSYLLHKHRRLTIRYASSYLAGYSP